MLSSMPEFRTVIDIDAPRAGVWAVLRDVERWPEWTASVREVRLQSRAALEVGAQVRVVQPRLPSGVWTVTACEADRGFEWVLRNPGSRITAGHWIEDLPQGCRVLLSVRLDGALSGLIGWMTGSLTRRYMAMEAEGLKKRSEAR